MKFSPYQSRVQLNTSTPTVQTSGNPMAYGMGGRAFDQMGNALGKVGAVLQKKQDEDDAADILEARNRIMTSLTDQLYNSETGLMTTGIGDNAKGLADRVTQAVRQTTEDVSKDYNSRVQKALQRNIKENMENFQRNAASREAAEAQKMVGVRYKANLDNSAQLAALNYNNDETIDQQLKDSSVLTAAMAQQLGQNSVLPTKMREMTTSVIGSAVKSAIENEDYERAGSLLEKHKENMSQDVWNSLHHSNTKLLEQQRKKNLLDAALSAGSYGDAVAMIEESGLDASDQKRMISAIRSEFGVSSRGGTGGGRTAGGYTQKQFNSDSLKWRTFKHKLVQGDAISPAQWTEAGHIKDRMEEAGTFSDELSAEIDELRANPQFFSKLTDEINVIGYDGVYTHLVDGMGVSRDAAAILMAELDMMYQTTGKRKRDEDIDEDIDEDNTEEDEPMAGMGGDY